MKQLWWADSIFGIHYQENSTPRDMYVFQNTQVDRWPRGKLDEEPDKAQCTQQQLLSKSAQFMLSVGKVYNQVIMDPITL